LKSTVEPIEGNQVRLTVTVPAEEVDRAIATAYTQTAAKVRIPGFRKGKAPRKVIDSYLGRDQILAEALEAVVQDSYDVAVDENDLRPIDQPDTGELAGLVEHEDYTYSAEVAVRPELTLEGDWRDITVETGPEAVSDAEIDAQIDHTRERFASLEPVEDRGIERGDFALLSFVGLIDGEPYEGNTVDKYLYETGKGQMPEEFDAALIGAKPGDTVSASFVIPETSSVEEYVGKTATFEITVHEVKAKRLPPLDDDFAINAGGFDSLEDMRADIRARMEENKKIGHAREVERLAREQLATHLVGEAPEVLVKQRRDQMLREFFSNLEQQGISLADYIKATDIDPERIQSDIELEARTRVTQEFALEALFRAEGMELTDQDIEDEFAGIADAEKSAAQLREEWEKAGMSAVLREAAMHTKAAKWLHEHAKVVEVAPEAEAGAAAEKPAKGRKSTKKVEE
jgi:trigger factor